jgi:hypothetical protein
MLIKEKTRRDIDSRIEAWNVLGPFDVCSGLLPRKSNLNLAAKMSAENLTQATSYITSNIKQY